MKFSERYGYEKPSEVIIRERITPEIQNAICTCFDLLKRGIGPNLYKTVDEYIWCFFLNQRKDKYSGLGGVITYFIENDENEWYKKLDLIETALFVISINTRIQSYLHQFANHLNLEFKRLNFAYRIVENQIVEITSEQEIKTLETAIENNKENIKLHLNNALKLYAQRPNADYRNSIKESITAVEAFTREITGDKGLNLGKMESAGIQIPPVLRKSFEILYGYTNDPTTGIRHALMDETAEYVPGVEEALFMLVSCSAFINYLNNKKI